MSSASQLRAQGHCPCDNAVSPSKDVTRASCAVSCPGLETAAGAPLTQPIIDCVAAGNGAGVMGMSPEAPTAVMLPAAG